MKRGDIGCWVVVFLVSFLSFIQTSSNALGVEFVSFVEGDPGVPGDGVFVSPEPFAGDFHFAPSFALSGITDGITITIFPHPSDIADFEVPIFVGIILTAGFPCITSAGPDSSALPITLNGATGFVFNYSQSILENTIEFLTNTVPECNGLTINDFSIFNMGFADLVDDRLFLDLDAVAIGFGQNAIPTIGTIEGTVYVSNGITISGALINIEPGGFITETDADGYYSFNLPPNIYQVIASAIGYESDAQSNVVVEENDLVIVNLTLQSLLVGGIGFRGKGVLNFIAEIFEVSFSTIIKLVRGGSYLWEGIRAAILIDKAGKKGDLLQDPEYWANTYNEIYENDCSTDRFVIDDCVLGEFGTTWGDLEELEKQDEDLQLCIKAALGGLGGVSGTINLKFFDQFTGCD